MERSLFLFISYTIGLSVAGAFDIPQECLVSSEWEGQWDAATNMEISFWVPLSGDEANSSTALLSVKLSTDRKETDNNAFIEFRKPYIPTTYSGDKGVNGIPQTHGVEVSSEGWTDLFLASGDGMRVLDAEGKEMLSLNESLQPSSTLVVVRGHFVTVNCRKPLKVWSLAADNGTSSVPLFSKDHLWSRLTLYSEAPSTPRLRLSEDSNTFLLGWNGTSVCAVSEEEFGDGYIPLPPSAQHNLTISCRKEAVAVFCDVLSGTEGRSIWSVQLISIPGSLTVQASSGEHLYVLLHRRVPLSLQEGLKGGSRREKTAGQIVALVIIGLVFVSITLLVVVSSLQHDRIMGLTEKRPSFADIFPVDEESESSEQEESESPLLPPRGSVIMEEQTLWEAVEKDDLEAVKHLLEEGCHPDDLEGDRISSPFMDAHLLGRREVVDVFASFKGEKYTTAQDDLVKSVMYELERNMKEIFLAAEVGMYTHEQGVKALLKAYSLPATICDSHGRSLLHYMVSVTAMDGVPPWQPKDMRSFFSSHEFVANAVDHRGRTALHELSQHPRTVETDVIWDGKEWTLPEAWLALARLLVSNGCDPRIPDHRGRRPQELAQEAGNVELVHYLEEKCLELDNSDPANGIDHFDDLVNAARQGDTCRLQGLLKRTPLLPVSAREDPLVEAIRHHQRDAMFMLLAAGAPIANRSVGEVTPLEAAHNTLGLAACFPAVLRKVFCERMEDEISRVSQEDETLKPLRQSMTAYNLQVMDVGSKARWIFQEKDEVTRPQERPGVCFLQASALGLSISCQLLGLENYSLHPLPGEPNPSKRLMKIFATYYTIPQLPHDTALLIKNEENEQTQAYETVKRRGTILNISSISNLFQKSKAKCCMEMDTEDIKRFIQTEIHSLEKLLNESGCQGTIIPLDHSMRVFCNTFLNTFLQNVLDILIENLRQDHLYISLVPPFTNRAPDGTLPKLWHTLALGLELLPERGMRSLFLSELAESQEWDKHQLPERLVSVLTRACKRDLREKLVPKEYINSFVTPRHFCCRAKESVCGVLQYLEELPEVEQQVQDKVVTFAEP
ncbi:uncharacterized protein LOC135200510 [Macrobrachium nipponense]|uniref:uncharacterized protein LOC135200510 n=1 Tax=Macrobrachium nipponense TaxID=159736 RepID=UPI0030C8A556